MSDIQFIICQSQDDFDRAKQVAKDYMIWLNMDLGFQNTEKEFAGFESMYGGTKGCYILALENDIVMGGVALRFFDKGRCEMKRLFVYERAQGKGLGRILCERIIQEGKRRAYHSMLLDTVERLHHANSLYESMGFEDIEPYYFNPDPTARFMELVLIAD